MALLDRNDVDYVEDPHTAARLLLELKQQKASTGLPPGRAKETQAAINKLLATFPDAADVAATASEDQLGGLSPSLKRTRKSHRQEHGITAQQARNARRRGAHKPKPTPTPKSKPAKSTRRRRGAGFSRGIKVGPTFDRMWDDTGVPDVYVSGRELALQGIGLVLVMSFLLLVLRDAEAPAKGWPSIVQQAVKSLTTGVRAIVGITDPLHPHTDLSAATGGSWGAWIGRRPNPSTQPKTAAPKVPTTGRKSPTYTGANP